MKDHDRAVQARGAQRHEESPGVRKADSEVLVQEAQGGVPWKA